MRRWISAFILILVLSFCVSASVAETRTPKPFDIIPDNEISPLVEGQHHYLLLCTDVWHGNPDNLGNTDGIMLVTLDTRAHRVMLTSCIRDAIIEKPAEPDDPTVRHGRINYIAKTYGPDVLCGIMSRHLDVRIEKYILFDFTQIANIVDYLGGVDIELNASEISYLQRYAVPPGSVRSVTTGSDLRSSGNHPAGVYHFSGHSAVLYMRIRKAGNGGDFMRTQRARTVLSTLADKCRDITWEEAEALVNNIMDNNTMSNMNLETMLEAAGYAFKLRDCTIEELRIPIDGAATPINFAGMAVQEIDWAACRQTMRNFLETSFLVIDDD